MYFVDEEVLDSELLNVQFLHRDFYAMDPEMPLARGYALGAYAFQGVPTHTEDGIPIRKLYVSNLPPKTTRKELFGVFTQYGYIKSCWLRMADVGPNKGNFPTYGFVTFSNPSDAYKALIAPNHERILRGNTLRISPADSWHQPAEDAQGNVRWRPRGPQIAPPQPEEGATADLYKEEEASTSEENAASNLDQPEGPKPIEKELKELILRKLSFDAQCAETSTEAVQEEYTVLDILNRDCWNQILSYIPITDLVRSERVSKQWQEMIQEFLQGFRLFRTSWWKHTSKTLTTAILRRVLQRLGPSLTRLHIDHHWSALNDRTAHTVGKFCPYLEELKVVGMYTKNWNPLIYGCKQLKILSFISCNKLTDTSLMQFVKKDSTIESLTIANNTHVTGLFLTEANASNLGSISFYNCHGLQGAVLSATLEKITALRTLKLDVGSINIWRMVPDIIKKLPALEELSLSEYMSIEMTLKPNDDDAFCEALKELKELKSLNVNRNIYITNAVLKQVAATCVKLETINVSSCNSRRKQCIGVTDEGLTALCRGCLELKEVDVSYLAGLTDVGLTALSTCHRLESLISRGNLSVTAAGLAKCLRACHLLETLDACGCDLVTEELITEAVAALEARPRALALHMAATAATADLIPDGGAPAKHALLHVNLSEDSSNPHLRPDFVDRVFEDNSDNSFDDLYDPYDVDEFHDFFSSDDDGLLDDDDFEEEFEIMQQIGLRSPDLLLL